MQANEAEFDEGDYDDGREQHAYRARMDKFSKTLCDNCGEVGHIYPNCKKQPAICDECGDKHDTRFHDRVQERIRGRAKRERTAGKSAVDTDVKRAASDKKPKRAAHLAETEGVYEAAFRAIMDVKKKEAADMEGFEADIGGDADVYDFFGNYGELEDQDLRLGGLRVTERELDLDDVTDEPDAQDIVASQPRAKTQYPDERESIDSTKMQSNLDYITQSIPRSVWSTDVGARRLL